MKPAPPKPPLKRWPMRPKEWRHRKPKPAVFDRLGCTISR